MKGEKPEIQPEKNGMRSKEIDVHIATRDMAKEDIKKSATEDRKHLVGQVNRMTVKARGEGGDIPSLIEQGFRERMEEKNKKMYEPVLKELDDMFATYDSKEDYQKFLGRVRELVDKSKKDVTKLNQAVLYAVKALAGYNGKIEVGDYAYFNTLLDNIYEIYDKETKVVEIFANLQKESLTEADWDVICKNIKSTSFTRIGVSAGDELKLSISAFFVEVMTPAQRTQLLIEFNKRYGKKDAAEFANQMVRASIISQKQYKFVMTEITGTEYVINEEEEKRITKARIDAEILTRRIKENLNNPLAINAMERLFNGKAVGGYILSILGILGAISNWMNGLKEGKGLIGKLTKGLTNPYTWLSAGVGTLGAVGVKGAMTPGASSALGEPSMIALKQPDNVFGTHEMAGKQDYQMTVLADICADHDIVEDWLLNDKGFDDVWKFYQKKNFDERKLKSGMLTAQQKKEIGKGNESLYDEFLKYLDTKEDKSGAMKMRRAKDKYGQASVERMIFNITVAAHTLGINSTKGFNEQTTQKNIKYSDIFRDRQGLGPKPVPIAKTN
ncbi:hypothetical protein C0416_04255 [bacterium]|nr:hypothetical protein [bacterium]